MTYKTFISSAVALSMLAGIGLASQAEAYRTLSPKRIWDSRPVMIDINTRKKERSITDGNYGVNKTIAAIDDNQNGWNSALSNMVDGYTTTQAAVLGDGYPTITFNDPYSYCTGSCLAVTLTGYWHYSSGRESIDDADIHVARSPKFTSEAEDTANSCSNNEYFIEGVIIHEVGHVLGLNHSSNRKATMYSSVGNCDNTLDEIHRDDRDGIRHLY